MKLASYFSLDHFQPTENVIYLLIMSIPHVYYFWIWTNPSQFTRVCRGHDAVSVLATSASFIKVIQFVTAVYWYVTHGPVPNPFELSNFVNLVIGSILCSFGQVLNLSVYKTLGKNGVYYGSRLGKSIPWVTGFPFNTVPHPQYVGSVLTIWGFTVIFARESHISAGFITLHGVWTLYYFITGVYEQYL